MKKIKAWVAIYKEDMGDGVTLGDDGLAFIFYATKERAQTADNSNLISCQEIEFEIDI